jgi:hypothetical protein
MVTWKAKDGSGSRYDEKGKLQQRWTRWEGGGGQEGQVLCVVGRKVLPVDAYLQIAAWDLGSGTACLL